MDWQAPCWFHGLGLSRKDRQAGEDCSSFNLASNLYAAGFGRAWRFGNESKSNQKNLTKCGAMSQVNRAEF